MPRPVADVRRHQAATRVADLTPTELQAGSRRGQFPHLRAALACRLVAEGGLSLAETARHLAVSMPTFAKILRKMEGAVS
ncbi:MAG: hypothetical protein HY748_08180 [Elusimicrobia bacterium]|nr:hypothetical protein [Elusimicrobiota bacterium]